MARNLFFVFILSISFIVAHAQEKPKAELFEEFSSENECQIGAYLDNFFVTLQNNPKAKGTIIVYQSNEILPADYDSKDYIRYYYSYPRFRGFDASRLTMTQGGFREELSTELWIVPKGATPPKPTRTVPRPKIPENKTFLYDKYVNLYLEEFELQPIIEISDEGEEIGIYQPQNFDDGLTEAQREEERFDWLNNNFGEFLRKNKSSTGVLIFFADKERFDIDAVTLYIEKAREKLAKKSKLPPYQIQIFYGGYRSVIEVEYWIMTKNSGFPKIKPEKKENERSTNK